MAEDEKPPEGDKEPEKAPEKTPEKDADTDLLQGARNPDAVKNALDNERKAAKDARQRAEAAEAKVKEYDDRDKTEAQKLEDKAAEADKRASGAELKALRYEVAADKELPLKWAARLTGSTKKELEDDADALLKELKPDRPNFDGGARKPAATDSVDDQIRRMAGRR